MAYIAHVHRCFYYFLAQRFRQDYVEAAGWFHEAGTPGDPDAQFYLGALYERGDGVPQDYARALAWLKAAAQGNARAAALIDQIAQPRCPQPRSQGEPHLLLVGTRL